MADIISGIKTIDNTMQSGENWFVADEVSKNTRIPKIVGEPLLSYAVPANKKYSVQNITVFGYGNWRNIAGTQVNPGVFKLTLNATDKCEWRAQTHYNYTNLGRMLWKNCTRGGTMAMLGDGVRFINGDVIVIRVEPIDTTQVKLYWAWLEGVETTGGARVLEFGKAKIISGNTNLLTYNVGTNGFTLKNFGADMLPIDQNIDAWVRVDIKGQKVVETEFKYATDTNRPPQLSIPLFGYELLAGDTVEVFVADLWQAGEVFSATVFGTLSDVGGGGATFTEIKSVNPRDYARDGYVQKLGSRVR